MPHVPSIHAGRACWGLWGCMVCIVGGKWEVPGTGNRIKVNLVHIEASEGRFCTPTPAALHSRPPQSLKLSKDTANMPVDLNGYWKMISNENFEEYLKALGEFL